VGAFPHYGKLAIVSLLPLARFSGGPSRCPPALLLAVVGVHVVIGIVILVRMGNPVLANPRCS
jgi:hypothetical protein